MDNFNLKNFLTENKLTKTSLLREGIEENKTFTDRDEFTKLMDEKGYILKNPENKNNKEIGLIYYDKDGNWVASWDINTNTGNETFRAKKEPNPDLVYPKGSRMDESAKEKLKAKIKEMIIAELDGSAVTDEDYDFVAEGEDYEDAGVETGEVGEKDHEDYQELKKFLNTLKDNEYDDSDDDEYFFNIDQEEELEEGKFKLSEFFIDEAKKDEEVPAEEELSDEEIDTTIDTTDTGEDFNVDTSAVDPNIKAVQDALTQAQAAAKSINDEKLTQQIGNTITMFTRTHIANTEAPAAE